MALYFSFNRKTFLIHAVSSESSATSALTEELTYFSDLTLEIGDFIEFYDISGTIINIERDITHSLKEISEIEDELLYEYAKMSDELFGNYLIIQTADNEYWRIPEPLSDEALLALNQEKFIDIDVLNREMLHLINLDRNAQGIDRLNYISAFLPGSSERASEMRDNASIRFQNNHGELMAHVRDIEGLEWQTAYEYLNSGNKYKVIGENTAQNSIMGNFYQLMSERFLAELFFEQWKQSPSHYENMLDPRFNGTAFTIKVGNETRTQDVPELFNQLTYATSIYAQQAFGLSNE